MEYSKGEAFKRRLYEIIEASKKGDRASRAYDIMLFVAVFVGLIPLMMKTESNYTRAIDLFTVLVFLFDYVARLYTSDYKMGVKSYKAYLAYSLTPMALIDLMTLVPIISFINPSLKVIGLFRIIRVLRALKLVRYSKTVRVIGNILRRIKTQLMAVLLLLLLYIIVSALIVFQAEPDTFDTFFQAVYWATVSITTIGYGDIAPTSTLGQVLTMVSALVGVAVVALPSSLITASYMQEIAKQKGQYEI